MSNKGKTKSDSKDAKKSGATKGEKLNTGWFLINEGYPTKRNAK